MKNCLILIAAFILLSFQLPFQIIGNYKTVFDKRNFTVEAQDFMIKINQTTYSKVYENGVTVIGKIKTHDQALHLRDSSFVKPKIVTDSLGNKHFERTILEIRKTNSDTLLFRTTFENDLGITINRGKLVPIK